MSAEDLKPITLNQTNLSNTTTGSQFTYRFPGGGSATFENAQLALTGLNLYNNVRNINQAAYNNNTFSIIFPTAATTYTLVVTLPDSRMSYSDINSYVQGLMITAGLYLVNGANNVYFWSIQENPSLYACQINEFPVPTAVGTYTAPPTGIYSGSGTGLPATAYTTQTVIPSTNNFGLLVGLTAATYPAAQQTAQYSISSTFTPQINPVQSLNVHCSLVSNNYTNPPDFLSNINPNAVAYGELFSFQPSTYQWISIPNQIVGQVTIYFTDQLNNLVYFQDSNVTISLSIRTFDRKKTRDFNI